jgi:hypothetical protein
MSYLNGYQTIKIELGVFTHYRLPLCLHEFRLRALSVGLFENSLWMSINFIDVTREEDNNCFGKQICQLCV